jgi:uncharacterized membrane protein HdeD (DUF308 family)
MPLQQELPGIEARINAPVREHWKAFLFEGIVLVLLGVVAIMLPRQTRLVMTFPVGWMFVFFGWIFVAGGLAGLVQTFWARRTTGFWWSLHSALLAIVAGIVLMAQPERDALVITLVIGAYFLAEGVPSVMYALEHRRALSARWNWLLVVGIMDVLLAATIVVNVPETAVRTLGMLVGIKLVFGGVSLIGIARAARNS